VKVLLSVIAVLVLVLGCELACFMVPEMLFIPTLSQKLMKQSVLHAANVLRLALEML
jgi:hypothetical protein